MTQRPKDLPNFDLPPVDEVIIGLQFAPVSEFERVLSSYLSTVADDFPNQQVQPRLNIGIEQLISELPTPPVMPNMLVGLGADFGRTWLVNRDESRLIQIQNDLFMHNWRKREEPYPHFDVLTENFWLRFGQFRGVVSERGVSPIRLLQLEVTYINWIPGKNAESFFALAESSRVDVEAMVEFPDYQQWVGSYLLQNKDGPIAKLTVGCAPGMRQVPKMERGFQLSLTFRSPLPLEVTDKVLAERMALARSTIVRTFTQLTTESSHASWGISNV